MAITLDGSNGITTPGGATTDDITFADNDKAIFGAGSDLQIYHDGSNSYINEVGTGSLISKSNRHRIQSDGGENMIECIANAEVALFFDTSKKIETTSTGVTVTGNIANASGDFTLDVAGNITLDADGGNVRFKDGGTEYGTINKNGTANLSIYSSASDADILFQGNDGGSVITAMTIDMSAGGNVGIGGTPDSGRKLHIEGGDATVGITLKDTAGGQFGINSDGGSLIFKSDSANSERMLILSSGAKSFGAFKSENGGYNIYAGAGDSGSFAARFDGTGTGASNVVQITNGYGEVGSIKIASNGTTTNYNTGSDYRLKTDVQPVTDASARIQSLNPVNFEWIRSGTRTDGFLAHEAQAVVPDCVSGAHNEVKVWEDDEELPDGVSVGDNKLDDNGNTIPVYQGIDQSKLVPLLTAALQEALTEIASLKTRVEALEA